MKTKRIKLKRVSNPTGDVYFLVERTTNTLTVVPGDEISETEARRLIQDRQYEVTVRDGRKS